MNTKSIVCFINTETDKMSIVLTSKIDRKNRMHPLFENMLKRMTRMEHKVKRLYHHIVFE